MQFRPAPFLILLFLAIVAGAGTWYGSHYFSKAKAKAIVPESKPDEDQLKDLQALPYTMWSGNDAHPEVRGVTLYDREKAYYGFNFYTDSKNKVYLSDMNGKILHTWMVPGQKQCEYAHLLDNGDILAVCFAKALVKLDWDSNIRWIRKRGVHHDLALTREGNIYAIHRGKLITFQTRHVAFDQILFLTPDGIEIKHWSTYEHMNELRKFHRPSVLDKKTKTKYTLDPNDIYDYYHLNRIQLLPETELGKTDPRFRVGNLLLCFRNVDIVLILDQMTWEVLWHWGDGVLEHPHMPTMLSNGHILIFDNGVRRKYSRVIEIDPVSKKIVWEYKADPPASFYSQFRGSAQRLPNGNTLICEADNGHVFEVDAKGKKVWEFWNPELQNNKRKGIYRMIRLEASEVRPLLH